MTCGEKQNRVSRSVRILDLFIRECRWQPPETDRSHPPPGDLDRTEYLYQNTKILYVRWAVLNVEDASKINLRLLRSL
jgi:hypothetical protein